jgi:hydroxymethylpyrimidine pyrophosphatase-like HAD family hydrolase
MGNACEELKSRGWPVTLSNDQNGVAAAIEQMFGTSESLAIANANSSVENS